MPARQPPMPVRDLGDPPRPELMRTPKLSSFGTHFQCKSEYLTESSRSTENLPQNTLPRTHTREWGQMARGVGYPGGGGGLSPEKGSLRYLCVQRGTDTQLAFIEVKLPRRRISPAKLNTLKRSYLGFPPVIIPFRCENNSFLHFYPIKEVTSTLFRSRCKIGFLIKLAWSCCGSNIKISSFNSK